MPCKIETHGGSVIQFHVPQVQSLRVNGVLTSHEETVKGLVWWLTLKRGESQLGLFLHCKAGVGTPDFCAKTVYNIMLLSKNGPPKASLHRRHFHDGMKDGTDEFILWKLVRDPDHGYLATDGSLLIEAELSFELHLLPTFVDQQPLFESPLVVGDRTFYVCTHTLATHSTLFREFFFPEDGETSYDIISALKTTPETFLAFLRILHCSEMMPTEKNVEDLLLLANHLDSRHVRSICQDYLSARPPELSLAQRLLLAETYNLPMIKQQCLNDIQNSADILKMHEQMNLDSYDDATTAKVTRLLLDAAQRKIRDPQDPSRVIVDRSPTSCALM